MKTSAAADAAGHDHFVAPALADFNEAGPVRGARRQLTR